MRRGRALETGLVILGLAAALVPVPAGTVERWFSAGVYPHLQRLITPFGNLVPFAWFDFLLVAVAVGTSTMIVVAVRRAWHERRWQLLLDRGWTLLAAGATLYLMFLGLWGLNYRRVPMNERLEQNDSTPARAGVAQLGLTAVAAMNALHDRAHAVGWSRDEWRDAGLIGAFREVQALIEDTPPVIPARLKRTLLGPYFRWTGVDGMVNPFGLEVLINPDLLPWERPFVAAHEWAHLAGFAEESEASFVGWLACLRGNEAAQYSGWLYVFWEANGELEREDREMLRAALQPGPGRDVTAVVERLRRGQLPALRTASWAVYDQYLRANRVEEGIRSYGEVITLILRTRFDSGYRPVRRASPTSSR